MVSLRADDDITDRPIHTNVVVGIGYTIHLPNAGVKSTVRILFGSAEIRSIGQNELLLARDKVGAEPRVSKGLFQRELKTEECNRRETPIAAASGMV
jgi:hypothetical protein